MSKNIYWREPPPQPDAMGSSAHPLKGILAREIWDHDGSLRGESVTIESDDRIATYLEGYVAGQPDEDIEQFLKDLRKHGRLEVWIDE